MNRIGLDGLAVVDDGRLVGMVTRETVGALMLRRRGAERDGRDVRPRDRPTRRRPRRRGPA